MKLSCSFFMLLFSCSTIFGQVIRTDQFLLFNYKYNPALVGANEKLRLSTQYSQGRSFGEYEFENYLLDADFGIKTKRGDIIGFGVGAEHIDNDSYNTTTNILELALSYSYLLFPNKKFPSNISIGTSFDYINNYEKDSDEKFPGAYYLGMGMNFSTKRELLDQFNFGLSIDKIEYLDQNINDQLGGMPIIFKLNGDAEIEISDRFNAKPSFLLVTASFINEYYFGSSIAYNLIAKSSKFIELGLIYRRLTFDSSVDLHRGAFIPRIGFHSKSFTISASFDRVGDVSFGDFGNGIFDNFGLVRESSQIVLQYKF